MLYEYVLMGSECQNSLRRFKLICICQCVASRLGQSHEVYILKVSQMINTFFQCYFRFHCQANYYKWIIIKDTLILWFTLLKIVTLEEFYEINSQIVKHLKKCLVAPLNIFSTDL